MGPGYGYFFLISDGAYGVNFFIEWWEREREREREREKDREKDREREREREIKKGV